MTPRRTPEQLVDEAVTRLNHAIEALATLNDDDQPVKDPLAYRMSDDVTALRDCIAGSRDSRAAVAAAWGLLRKP